MTSADHDRLAGQISYIAQKGSLPRAVLVDLVDRLVGGEDEP